MELKNKIAESLLLLEADKNEVTKIFSEWAKFLQITPDDMKVKGAEDIFNKVLNTIKNIKDTLRNNLENNFDNFLEFFKVGVMAGIENQKEVQNLIISLINLEENDEDAVNTSASLENIVEIREKMYFLDFKRAAFIFFVDMCNILDEVMNYAKTLFSQYVEDEAFQAKEIHI